MCSNKKRLSARSFSAITAENATTGWPSCRNSAALLGCDARSRRRIEGDENLPAAGGRRPDLRGVQHLGRVLRAGNIQALAPGIGTAPATLLQRLFGSEISASSSAPGAIALTLANVLEGLVDIDVNFSTTPVGVKLTATGDELLEHAKQIFVLLEHAEQRVKGLESEDVGTFVLFFLVVLGPLMSLFVVFAMVLFLILRRRRRAAPPVAA